MVPAHPTPISPAEAKALLAQAFVQLTGALPHPQVLALLAAQAHFETAGFTKLMNYNFGGVKASTSWSGDKTTFSCSEGYGADKHTYPAGDMHCIFKSYGSAAEGAKSYVSTIVSRPDWKLGLLTGDPDEYVRALVGNPSRKYFTGDPAAYAKGLRGLVGQYGGKVGATQGPSDPSLSSPASSPSKSLGLSVDQFKGLPAVGFDVLEGPFVRIVEKLLGLPVTGVYGDRLKSAILVKQDHGFSRIDGSLLKKDGIVGAHTWSSLL
jgi:hypothetical protein